MKTFLFILSTILLLSCGNSTEKKQTARSKSAPKISAQSVYESYSPANLKLPEVLFVAIDAHADARLAINHFRWTADQYGFRIIALKNVKNNDSKFMQHIAAAISVATNQFQFKQAEIYLAGFSGGARMALNYAQTHAAKGVIMMGAGPGNQSGGFPFPLAMISGTRDFNFVEQHYPISSPRVDNPNLITLHWQGKHAWPDSLTIWNATTFVLYRSGKIEEQDIDRRRQLAQAKKYKEQKNIFFYFKQLELISKTSVGDLHDKAESSLTDIRNSARARDYFNRFDNTLTAEQKRNRYYMQDLEAKPLDWWREQISKLDELINSSQGMEADSYARNRAFLGILLYSRTRSALSGRGNAKLVPKYLKIYEMLEPENPDVYYFKARYAYIMNQNENAIKELKRALELGYTDDEQLHQSFPQVIISRAKQ
jgi:pimeloyl-ACP methyl ester carboxylesterase